MNEEVKKLWTDALDLNPPQIVGQLQNKNGFCCLGVLCDLAVQAGVLEEPRIWREDESRSFPAVDDRGHEYDEEALLPLSVQEWAGLDTRNPSVEVNGRSLTLSAINDTGKSFSEISSLIKEQL